jgi:hypothetical protein
MAAPMVEPTVRSNPDVTRSGRLAPRLARWNQIPASSSSAKAIVRETQRMQRPYARA